MQSYNQKMRNLPKIELVPTILQSFSSTLSKRDICASPNGVHVRELTVGLCNTTLLPLRREKYNATQAGLIILLQSH